MSYILFLVTLLFVICLIHSKNGFEKTLWFYIAVFVLMGSINKEKYTLLLEPSDWITLILLSVLIIYGLCGGRKYVLKITWPDLLLLFYFSFTIYMPLVMDILNPSPYPYSHFTFLMPMRIWFVYRIFFYILSEANAHRKEHVNFHFIINVMLVIGFISALIAISRHFPIPYVHDFIDNTWPTKPRHLRLAGTMSGINGTGNFFAFLTVFALYRFQLTYKFRYIVCFCLFSICILLTGSFSSICTIIVGLTLFIKKYANKKVIRWLKISAIAGLVVVLVVPKFSDIISTRFKKKFQPTSEIRIIPNNLRGRLSYWKVYSNSLLNKYEGIYGFGPGGMYNDPDSYAIHGNAESFYFRVLGDSGFIGLLAFFVIIYYILKKLKFLRRNSQYVKQAFLMKIIIIMFLVSGVANQTLYYGGSLEIFAIILAASYMMDMERRVIKGQKWQWARLYH